MKKLLVVIAVCSLFSNSVMAKKCGRETGLGAVVGGVFGAVLGGIVDDKPGLGAVLGAGAGAIVANKSCKAQRAFERCLDASAGEYFTWEEGGQYGYFEVEAVGDYYSGYRYFTECRLVTSFYNTGVSSYGYVNIYEEYDVVETRVFCSTENGVEVFTEYEENFIALYF
jgi:hypothetical protein